MRVCKQSGFDLDCCYSNTNCGLNMCFVIQKIIEINFDIPSS